MPPKPHVAAIFKSKAWNKASENLLENQDKVGEKLVVIPGAEGTRIWPAKSPRNDAESQLRIDRGSTIHNLPNHMKVYLQVNKEAKEGSLKSFLKASDRGTHANVAEAVIDTTKSSGEKIVDMISQFKAASETDEKEEGVE
jgi:hypothetical protein